MITMKLVKRLGESFAIYEIPKDLKKKYCGNYILKAGVYSEYAKSKLSDKEVIENLKEDYYEDIFETIREAELTVRYAETMSCLSNLLAGCNMFHDEVKRFKKWQDRIVEEE